MKWWKRLVFSLISVIGGFCSLDYLIYAFRQLVNAGNVTKEYNPKGDPFVQLLGAGMFLVWFVIVYIYILFIRKASVQVDLIEEDQKTGQEKIKRKWFDILLQMALILTGLFFRWCYLIFIYFPNYL